ncbi:hypothetical protein IDG52_03245, partial [Pelagibacterales bacterium SAG-MED23]|nr:hypothetical protein [Pelagibacterales bacterium SAG-MED23]
FVISLISICSINLFKKLILKNDPPLKRWPKNTPFDFEKNSVDTHWLPFRFGIPKDEFFKCIDKEWDKDGKRLGQFRNSKNNVYQLLKKIFKFSIYLSIEKPKIIVREVINKFISRNLK